MWIIRSVVGKIIGLLLMAALVVATVLGVLGGHNTVNNREGVAIVLGAGFDCDISGRTEPRPVLKERLDQTIRYHRENPTAMIIVTGGNPRERLCTTEAAAMQNYLLMHGVPYQLILLEERATSTAENLEFAQEIMERRGLHNPVIITSRSHMFRASRTARRLGMNVNTLAASEPMRLWPLTYGREVPATVWFLINPPRPAGVE
jgi:uncharacterized SAM-binding protein YcdF (DUF218 family)